MADEHLQTDTQQTKQGTADTSAETTKTEGDFPTSWDEVFKHDRFKQLAERAKAAETKLEMQTKEREENERRQLEEQQKYKELYEKNKAQVEALSPYKERFETYQTQVAERNKQRVESIPKEMRSLVPEYDDPFKLAAWLDNNQAVFSKTAAPKLDGGAGGATRRDGESIPTEQELREMAAVYNVSYEALKAQYGLS